MPPHGSDDVERFLAEDVGEGDVTTLALDPDRRVEGNVVAREACTVAGLAEASSVFAHLGAKVEHRATDGDRVGAGTVLLVVRGPAGAVFGAERVALNLLMRMCGIATLTRRLADAASAANPACRIAATRKTTPGFRAYEKRAVVLGGGDPHRARLDSAFLVKDNHLAAGIGIAEAVRRCRVYRPGLPVEVEADTEDQAVEAARAGADWILLDNMGPAAGRKAASAARRVSPGVKIESSGGIGFDDVAAFAAYSDRVSLGRLTLAAPAVDLGLDLVR